MTMTSSKEGSQTKSAYDAFNAVDSLVSKPVLGSDGARSWQSFQTSDKALKNRQSVAPTAPLKKADRESGITSWQQEREIETKSREGQQSQGYTHFKKRPQDEIDSQTTKKSRQEAQPLRGPESSATYYISAETFKGSKRGYVFTTRNGKTGYYWDGTDSRGFNESIVAEAVSNDDGELRGAQDGEEPAKEKKKKKKPQPPRIVSDPNHPLEQIAARLGQATASLPEGWQAAKDSISGKTYYFNRLTSQRQWHPPGSSKKEKEDHGLPAGWSAAQDPSSGKTYYYNAETKETKWERPAS